MNVKTVRVKIIILFVLGCISHQLFAQVDFEETNLKTAQSQIAATQTPYLIYFSGVWCPSCQLMEETTFTDQKLGDQIQENYLAYKVDVDSKEGKKWMKEYAVTCLPTTIFYSANGQLLERLEKPITSTEMLAMTTESGYKNSSLIAKNSQHNAVENSSLHPNSSAKNPKIGELADHSTTGTNNPPNGNGSSLNSDEKTELSNVENSSNPSTSSSTNTSDLAYANKMNPKNAEHSTNIDLLSQNEVIDGITNLNSNDINGNNTPSKYGDSSTQFSKNKGKLGFENSLSSNEANRSSNSKVDDQYASNTTNISTKNATPNSTFRGYTNTAANTGNFSTASIANFSNLIEELDAEINELKALKQSSTSDHTKSKSNSNNPIFNGVNSNGAAYLDSENATTFLSPSTDNLMAQISACKALLTDVKSLDKLIGILENYQRLLKEMRAAQVQLAQQAIPSERKTPSSSPNAKSTKSNNKNQVDLFALNQQIINHLKLKKPIKNGNQYIVQIGKYSNVRNAERLVQIIQDKYDYPIKVLIENKNNLPIQTVYLGEFKTQKEAIAANENLKWIKRKGIVKRF